MMRQSQLALMQRFSGFWGQIARRNSRDEILALVRPVAKWRVGGVPATAQGHRRPPSQPEFLAVLIHDREFPLHTHRAVMKYRDFCTCQVFLRCSQVSWPDFRPAKFCLKKLIPRNRRIHLRRPRQDSPAQIMNFAEARLAEEVHRFCRALAAAAMRHDLVRGIQFVHPPRQFTERNQMTIEIANLVFMRLAHIQDVKVVAVPLGELPRTCRLLSASSSPRMPQNSL